jgi:crossover junction endodeoxyribonuclease RusA
MIQIELPWPPSANTYWRRNGHRYFISERGIEFRNIVYQKTVDYRAHFNKDQRIMCLVEAYPPDKRRRDLDNMGKALLDALQFSQVFPDDSQIDRLSFWRLPMQLNKIVVTLSEI